MMIPRGITRPAGSRRKEWRSTGAISIATSYRLADQWIVFGDSGTADGTHPVQPSADPKSLIAESQDETIPVSL
jgi:hypothetical protein